MISSARSYLVLSLLGLGRAGGLVGVILFLLLFLLGTPTKHGENAVGSLGRGGSGRVGDSLRSRLLLVALRGLGGFCRGGGVLVGSGGGVGLGLGDVRHGDGVG